jgi:hypothetical protein
MNMPYELNGQFNRGRSNVDEGTKRCSSHHAYKRKKKLENFVSQKIRVGVPLTVRSALEPPARELQMCERPSLLSQAVRK